MSNAVFPVMPGLTWDITRVPIWSTTVKTSVSGREFRSANFSFPRYRYKMVYSVLRQTSAFPEMAQMAGFFNARNGAFDSFLFTDPDDYTIASGQVIGTGDGVNKLFQLVRTFGGYVEPVFDLVSGTYAVSLNGVVQVSGVSINATGLVSFTTAPGAGVVVSWGGNYYRRMRFEQDMAEFNQFMQRLWDLKTLTLLSVKP